jgi:hypothetical protein
LISLKDILLNILVIDEDEETIDLLFIYFCLARDANLAKSSSQKAKKENFLVQE